MSAARRPLYSGRALRRPGALRRARCRAPDAPGPRPHDDRAGPGRRHAAPTGWTRDGRANHLVARGRGGRHPRPRRNRAPPRGVRYRAARHCTAQPYGELRDGVARATHRASTGSRQDIASRPTSRNPSRRASGQPPRRVTLPDRATLWDGSRANVTQRLCDASRHAASDPPLLECAAARWATQDAPWGVYASGTAPAVGCRPRRRRCVAQDAPGSVTGAAILCHPTFAPTRTAIGLLSSRAGSGESRQE